jgi:transcriptional regulator with XRE-family HTH domain
MTRVSELHKKWMDDSEYAKAYGELETEFAIAREMIEARARAGLTQDELASRMDTSRTVIARLESGRSLPSTRTLKRFAAATGSRLAISFVPVNEERGRKARAAARSQ